MDMFRLTRRKFLGNMTGAGMALSMGSIPSLAFKQKKESENSGKVMVFSKQLEWITDYEELCDLVAEIGFDGIELTVRPGGHVLPESVEEDLPRAVEAAKKAGVKIMMISTQIKDPNDPYTEKILNTANQLGIGLYRMAGLSYDESIPIEQNLEEFKSVFQDLAEINQQYNIHGAYQNHAGSNRVSAAIWDLWFLLKDLDSRWIGCQYDSRHAQLEGGSCWPIGLQLLNPYIRTTVAKDFKWVQDENQLKAQNCPLGEGAVNFDHHFSIIKKFKIEGPISLHFPYSFLNDSDTSNKKKRLEKTVDVMRQKGIVQLKAMLQQAGIT